MGYGEGNHKEKPLSIFRIQYRLPSLPPQFPRRVWHPTKYTVTAIWALCRSVRIRQTIFRPPSQRICVLVDAKRALARSLDRVTYRSVSVISEGLQTTCALCFPCHTRAPPHVSHLCVMIHAKERTRYVKSVAYGNEATGRRSGVEGRREAASAKNSVGSVRQESERAVENGESANALRWRALADAAHSRSRVISPRSDHPIKMI